MLTVPGTNTILLARVSFREDAVYLTLEVLSGTWLVESEEHCFKIAIIVDTILPPIAY